MTLCRDSYQINNQNLISLLSKTFCISASIDEHINRRLNRILKSSQANQPPQQSSSTSIYLRATAGHDTSQAQSPRGLSDGESNEDLSDEGLDLSQRICDSLASGQLNTSELSSDEAILGKHWPG